MAEREKQIVITLRGGVIQNVETNFDCSYQIIDYDNMLVHDDDMSECVGDILEPDTIHDADDIFVE